MAQFPLQDTDQITHPLVQDTYAEISAELGFGIVPNLFKSMAIRPEFLSTTWKQFRSTILKGTIPRTIKEMIGVAISQANSSDYALKVHLHSLSALGISEQVLQMLVSDFDNCPLPEREKSVIRFGLLAATKPQQLSDADYQHLYELGLDQSEIFELITTANLFTAINQYTDAIALEIDTL
ncbi:carboxymuconolactone decarboxylase family protein [Coleofasciculus sp.]|uniref:carboxymuconolactone decarboxylase family protein n=1 Tax=Coleofasciculus sp. TaxID=3100458 RepID=UPI0039F85CA1